MIGVRVDFRWFGERAVEGVAKDVGAVLERAGAAWLDRARVLVPVRTGRLRAGLYYFHRQADFYRASDLSLVVGDSERYARFVEMGTRFMMARPFIRPALEAIGGLLGQARAVRFATASGARGLPSVASRRAPRPRALRLSTHARGILAAELPSRRRR